MLIISEIILPQNNVQKEYKKRHTTIRQMKKLLLLTISAYLVPALSMAQVSGPNSPDFSSFEPVDATNMVDMATGDFIYNIPIIEIPGPEGGYPLSLSYHANIKAHQEASWVGLGWTLNPGAINRQVNVYADDFNRQTESTRDSWEGGSNNTTSIGLGGGFGIGYGYIGGMAGIIINKDTYRGTNYGWYGSTGGGVGLGEGNGPNIGLNFSYAQFDGEYTAGVNLGVSVVPKSANAGGLGAGASVGMQYSSADDSWGTSAGVGISAYGMSVVGASISSRQSGASISVLGVSHESVNNNAGKISTHTNSFSFTTPTPYVFLSLSQTDTRYWSDNGDFTYMNGMLYMQNATQGSINNGSLSLQGSLQNAMDCYMQPNISNISDFIQNPELLQGGSFAAPDNYNVTAQGISGSMRPYIYSPGHLFRRATKSLEVDGALDVEYTYKPKEVLSFDQNVQFRFVGEFSNSLLMDPRCVRDETGADPYYKTSIDYTYNNAYATSDANKPLQLHSPTPIRYFTNEEIATIISSPSTNASGFIPYDIDGRAIAAGMLERTNENVKNLIGGFMITNTSGVTYHYSLPVYNHSEYTRIENNSDAEHENGYSFRQTSNTTPYAYTWLLTAITGPDYVDRGENSGKGTRGPSADDYGYWVVFEYGRWADKYLWRTPFEGKTQNLIGRSMSYSWGEKELYYLDAIRTRTHTAVFAKSVRNDAKSPALITEQGDCFYEPQVYSQFLRYSHRAISIEDGVAGTEYKPLNHVKDEPCACLSPAELEALSENGEPTPICDWDKNGDWKPATDKMVMLNNYVPVSTLKLDSICLYANNDLPVSGNGLANILRSKSGYDDKYQPKVTGSSTTETKIIHNRSQVILSTDGLSEYLKKKSLKTVVFKTDYSLAPYQPNSYDLPYSPMEAIYGLSRNNIGKILVEGEYQENNAAGLITNRKEALETTYSLIGTHNDKISVHVPQDNCISTEYPGAFVTPSSSNHTYASLFSYKKLDKTGKLTLKSISIKGRKSTVLIPDTKFSYEPSNSITGEVVVTSFNLPRECFIEVISSNEALAEGNIIKINRSTSEQLPSEQLPSEQYFYLKKKTGNSRFNAIWLNELRDRRNKQILYPFTSNEKFVVTKNAPYSCTGYDNWLNFHPDIDPANLEYNEQLARLQTETTAKSIDVWSLRTIELPTGAQMRIAYEPDQYLSAQIEKRHFNFNQKNFIKSNGKCSINISTTEAELLNRFNNNYSSTIKLLDLEATDPSYTDFVLVNRDASFIFFNSTISWDDHKSINTFGAYMLFTPAPASRNIEYGGGLRVKNIDVSADGRILSDTYSFLEGKSSYTPYNLSYSIEEYKGEDENLREGFKHTAGNFLEDLIAPSLRRMTISNEIATPGVVYGTVEMQKYANGIATTGVTEYKLQTYEDWMVKHNSSEVEKRCEYEPNKCGTYGNPNLYVLKETYQNATSMIGSLLSVTSYAKPFNGVEKELSKVEYTYLIDKAGKNIDTCRTKLTKEYNGQGLLDEIYFESRKAKVKPNDAYSYNLYKVMSKREIYPNVLLETRSTNNQTGISRTERNVAFDYLTGKPVVTVTSDGYGRTYASVQEPAYWYYPAMGCKTGNVANYNMLEQTAGSYLFRVTKNNDGSNIMPTGLLSAQFQTWNTGSGVPTPKNSYVFMPESDNSNGDPYPIGIYSSDPFTALLIRNKDELAKRLDQPQHLFPRDIAFAGIPASNSPWICTGGVSAYSKHSKAQEVFDINNNYSAVLYDSDEICKIFSGTFARKAELAYSGMEQYTNSPSDEISDLDVQISDSRMRADEYKHTGAYSLAVFPQEDGYHINRGIWSGTLDPSKLDPTRRYCASVWVYTILDEDREKVQLYYTIDPTPTKTPTATVTWDKETGIRAGAWILLEMNNIDVSSGSTIKVGCHNEGTRTVYFDDFRFSPINSSTAAYVYDPVTGKLTYTLNNDNIYTRFEYDAMGRLWRTYSEKPTTDPLRNVGEILVTQQKINYGKTNGQ